MSEQETAFPSPPAEPPVDPLYSHAASPFIRTEVPAAVAAPAPASTAITPMSAWSTYKTQIMFGFAILAYLMFLVGAITLLQANRGESWKYYVVALPLIPTVIIIWMTVRVLSRLDEVQKRTHMQALGFALAATGLLTFGYGFLEAVGWPQLNSTFVLPLIALSWGLGVLVLSLRYRFRR